MKNIRNTADQWLESLDRRWEELPIERQHKYLLYFFAGYLLLTIAVIVNVWKDTARSQNNLNIGHIGTAVPSEKKSPARLGDTLEIILNN
ncbi:nitrogen regulatory IIA protein [Flavobacterium notoginsengisoli]|uniref:nitrogen regulatory IIA protein n=1 Tax=Flavobacterium notoginsengisoli TaxID=1478199 RepID=UPI0036366D07